VTPQVAKWTTAVHDLAVAASRFPQSAYAGFTKSLQSEWQYLQHMVPGVGDLFTPLETAIRNKLLPSLLGSKDPPADVKVLSTLGTHQARLGVHNPVQTAEGCYAASTECMSELVRKLLNHNLPFMPASHRKQVEGGCYEALGKRIKYEQ